ncbi:MAG: IPT/TIG domain-containing protein [Myxococcota bacterium]
MRGSVHRLALASALLVAGSLAPFALGGCQQTDGTIVTELNDTVDGFILRKLRILAIDPIEGALDGGTLVAMTGTGFQPDMTVTFGGVEASGIIVGGDELAVMRTPAMTEPGKVDIVATLADGRTTTLLNGFEYVPKDEVEVDLLVLGVSPSKGSTTGGEQVVIEGKGFIDGASVFFGGVPASAVHVLGETALIANAPPAAQAGMVDVRVETPEIGGRPAKEDTLLNGYEYLPVVVTPPKPLLVLGVLPGEGPVGGHNLVTVKGQSFEPGAKVFFGDNLATGIDVLGSAAISCTVPAAVLAGRVPVRVENPAPVGGIAPSHTLADGYLYFDDHTTLRVTQVLPAAGPLGGMNTVTIAGQGFTADASVYFGGAPATEVTLLAGTVLTAKVPAGVEPGHVNVRVDQPGASGLDTYTLVAGYEYVDDSIPDEQLLVLGVQPNNGPLAGGNLVTIEGQGFGLTSRVYFGGTLATEVKVLGTRAITCKAPAGVAAGRVDLTVELPNGDSHTLADGYEYIGESEDQLLVLSAIPAEGPLSGNQVVAIAGQGFAPGAIVYFGSLPASQVNVLGPTALTLRTPAGAAAGQVDIRVEVPQASGPPRSHTLIRGFEYFDDTVSPDALRVLGVIPSSGPLAGGATVTIAGQGFVPGALVYLGGRVASDIQVLGPNAITVTTPAGVTAGRVDVRVEVPGGGAHSLPNAYAYVDDSTPPIDLLVLGAIPTSGPLAGGNVVTVSGQGFAPGASVFFAGVPATQVNVLGGTALTCLAPAGFAAGPPSGSRTSAATPTRWPRPTPTSTARPPPISCWSSAPSRRTARWPAATSSPSRARPSRTAPSSTSAASSRPRCRCSARAPSPARCRPPTPPAR